MRRIIRIISAFYAENERVYTSRKGLAEAALEQREARGATADVRHRQGRLLGQMQALGFGLREEAVLRTLTEDVVESSAIEGERLDPETVRSSIARRLGMDAGGLKPADRNIDGVVDMMLDATRNYDKPLTAERLCAWHASLFPTGRAGMRKIRVRAWRDDRCTARSRNERLTRLVQRRSRDRSRSQGWRRASVVCDDPPVRRWQDSLESSTRARASEEKVFGSCRHAMWTLHNAVVWIPDSKTPSHFAGH
jgi:hypothetical protein